jgi:hypothetical protein
MTTTRLENTAATVTHLADGTHRARVFTNARDIADQDLAGHPAADMVAMREFKTAQGALRWARRHVARQNGLRVGSVVRTKLWSGQPGKVVEMDERRGTLRVEGPSGPYLAAVGEIVKVVA